MKKVICSLLTILILINSAFVICYADSESFVTKAVNAVKSKIDIPENTVSLTVRLLLNRVHTMLTLHGMAMMTNSTPAGR